MNIFKLFNSETCCLSSSDPTSGFNVARAAAPYPATATFASSLLRLKSSFKSFFSTDVTTSSVERRFTIFMKSKKILHLSLGLIGLVK